jgi:flavodoxin
VKALVVYVSIHHGNTKRIAEVIAADLAAQVVTPTEIRAETLPEYDLVGFGSGIFYGSHHRNLIELAARAGDERASFRILNTGQLAHRPCPQLP